MAIPHKVNALDQSDGVRFRTLGILALSLDMLMGLVGTPIGDSPEVGAIRSDAPGLA